MRRSIRNRRGRHRVKRDFELQLTSMMDMLVILVVFMLKSYQASTVAFSTSSSIQLPSSTAEEPPSESFNLVVEPQGISFDGERVVEFQPSETPTYEVEDRYLSDNGRRILPLFDAMTRAREKADIVSSKAIWKDKDGKTVVAPKFHGTVIIQADKTLRYEVLKKLMYTAGAAQYRVFKLATIRKE